MRIALRAALASNKLAKRLSLFSVSRQGSKASCAAFPARELIAYKSACLPQRYHCQTSHVFPLLPGLKYAGFVAAAPSLARGLV